MTAALTMFCASIALLAAPPDRAGGPREDRSNDFAAKAEKLFYKDYFYHRWEESDHTVNGEDWSLPPWVKAAPYSGISIRLKLPPEFPGRLARTVSAPWRTLEPQEGHFEFGPLREAIVEASERGKYSVRLHVTASVWETRYFRSVSERTLVRTDVGSAPRWLGGRGIALVEEHPNSTAPFQVVNMDIYNPEYHRRYLKLIDAFGASGIPGMKELDLCYLHLKSASRGEEGVGPKPGDPNRKLFEERLAAWANAFQGVQYKLANVSNAEVDLMASMELGMGQRNGFVEHYMLHVSNAGLGQEVDENGYLVVDENCPLIAENRASLDENEEYRNELRFGPIETFPHRYRESMLRALEMRRNFLWAEGGRWFINPPLLNYVALELGKKANDAPDAWCYLRESRTRRETVKNFERWVFQRDAEGARTEPTEKVDVPQQMYEYHPSHRYDYTARKTNSARGQTQIRFGVDEAFLHGGPHRVAVKVTYLDRDRAEWQLEYHTSENQLGRRTCTCGDTGGVKTVTFILNGAYFPAEGYSGMDMQIRAVHGDVAVRMLRVIKLDAPVGAERL